MNLIGNNSNKTSLPQKNIKERFLNDQIQNLRQIYQQSQQFYEKMNAILKKTIQYNAQKSRQQDNGEISIINNFIDDLSQLEELLLSLSNLSESDNQHFSSTIFFKPYNKYNDALAFKKIMRSHEEFKENLNKIILRLEKDIQKLETNGYHIYDTVIKPNNVLNNLKKNTIEKYIMTLNQMQLVFNKIKSQMTTKVQSDKKTLQIAFKTDCPKSKDYYNKVLEQILLKQKLVNIMMVEQINNIKNRVKKYNRKLKDIQESISISKNFNKLQYTEIKILLTKYDELNDKQFKEYLLAMKQKTDKTMVVTNNMYSMRKKSLSCHNIIQTIKYSHPMKLNKNKSQTDSGSYQSSTHIMGCDILESYRLN